MSENLSAYENTILQIDVKNDGVIDGRNENQIKEFARNYAKEQRNTLTDVEFQGLINRIDTLLKRHDIDRIDLGTELERAKQGIRNQTKEQTSAVRPLQLSDIRSPAGLAHYIDQSDDRGMQALEQKVGLDNTWKILALTGAYTTVKILEAFVDILKIGEGVVKGANALSNEELDKWGKAGAIANGIGIDGLRALAVAGPVLSKFGQVLENIKISENLSTSVGNERKLGEVLKYERGAIGDLSKSPEKSLSFDITKNEVYKRHSVLREHAEFFGELKPSDIMGAGNNAIVVRHPKIEGQVVKIPYPGEVDSVLKEIRNHEKAYIAIKEGIKSGKISENITAPKLRKDFPDSKEIFTMQQVEGQSLHTRMILELPEYKNIVEKLAQTRDISKMTDNEIYRHLADKHPFGAEYLDMVIKGPESAKYTKMYIDSHPEIGDALKYLESKGVGHADVHGGNIMLGTDGKTYIIDFGRVSSGPTTPSITK